MGNCFSVKPESVHLPQDLNTKDLDSFVPPVNSGRVIKVYDGDTITVASKVPGLKNSPIYKFSVRLNGIDTPEIKGKNEDEKEIAQKARDALSGRIMGKDIFLKNVQTLNQWMIKQRYALAYDGCTKVIPKSWKNYHENNII